MDKVQHEDLGLDPRTCVKKLGMEDICLELAYQPA